MEKHINSNYLQNQQGMWIISFIIIWIICISHICWRHTCIFKVGLKSACLLRIIRYTLFERDSSLLVSDIYLQELAPHQSFQNTWLLKSDNVFKKMSLNGFIFSFSFCRVSSLNACPAFSADPVPTRVLWNYSISDKTLYQLPHHKLSYFKTILFVVILNLTLCLYLYMCFLFVINCFYISISIF